MLRRIFELLFALPNLHAMCDEAAEQGRIFAPGSDFDNLGDTPVRGDAELDEASVGGGAVR